jgi:glycosyltransferase involved in cell wall biosynthesis
VDVVVHPGARRGRHWRARSAVIRVLLVHQPTDGGVARHVADLFAGLRAYGHEPVLCGPQPPVSLRGQLQPGDHEPLAMQRGIAPGPDAEAARHLVGIVRRLRPDVVHAHSSKAGAVARAARLANPRIPVLYTPHGYAMAGFFDRGRRAFYREAERGFGLLTSRVLAVCEAEARLARTVTSARRVRVVHNGVEAPAAGVIEPDARVVELRSQGPVVCTVCQLRPGKGIETLVDAWPAVAAAQTGAQLAIVGDGEMRGELERRVRALGVGDSVHFLGEYANPIAVLQTADVFVLASWFEAFPYAILEAMALECSIVASDVGGIAEAITHGVSGMLVPAREPVKLATALGKLVGNADLRSRLGAAALSTVSAHFTVEAMVQGAAGVYDEALQSRPAAATIPHA